MLIKQCIPASRMLSKVFEQTTLTTCDRVSKTTSNIMNNEALFAARRGNVKKLKELISQNINLNVQDSNGRTLLHHAASNGHYKVVECLLRNNADVLVTTEKDNTVLHIAVMKSNDILVKVILENVVRTKLRKLLDVKTKNSGTTALHVAVKNDCFTNTSLLLEYGANFEMHNDASEKPIDLIATSEKIRELLHLIDTSFSKASSGELNLADDLEGRNTQDFISVLNCRNNDGKSIIQVLVLNEHWELLSDLFWQRIQKTNNRVREFLQDRKKEVEEFTKVAREFYVFWDEQKEIVKKNEKKVKAEPSGTGVLKIESIKLGCRAMEMAHKAYLIYREIEGKEKSITVDPRMKTLGEGLEALGFDPEELFVMEGENPSYYEKLPAKFKENLWAFSKLMDSTIYASIDYLLGYIYSLNNFNAVDNNDMDKVQQLIDMNVINHGFDHEGRTALYHAIERGNEDMVKLLLSAKAGVSYANYAEALSPVYLAASKGYVRIVKMLLKTVHHMEIPRFIDQRQDNNRTALHVAAIVGNVDIVKTLLRYRATYLLVDGDDKTPLELSTNEDVSNFLRLVDDCFKDGRRGKVEVVDKLKALQKEDFMAVVHARSLKGETIADVSIKSNCKASIAEKIWKMIDMINFKVL